MTESIQVRFEELTRPIFAGLPIQVTVKGPFSRRGGTPILATVGSQRLRAVSSFFDGSGFKGFLARRPNAGDELVLRLGLLTVPTGARVPATSAARSWDDNESDAFATVASVPPAQARALGVDVSRGIIRLDAHGQTFHAESLTRSWIIEEPTLTADARAFKPSRNDKTARVTLAVRVPRLPAGGSIRWNVPTANRGAITLSGSATSLVHSATGPSVDVIGLVPGLTFLDVMAFDAAGTQLESIKFPICVPQFIEIREGGAAFDRVLAALNIGFENDLVMTAAKQVCDFILSTVNVRTIWNVPAFRERLPAQFATGGLGAGRVTTATIQGDPPTPGLLGQTFTPAGAAVFSERIDIFPGAFDDPFSGSAAEEVDDMTRAAVASISHLANVSSMEKMKVIDLMGRLIGETLAHEIGHSLIGSGVLGGAGGHNPASGAAGALLHSLMNAGRDRSLTDRTGIRPIASPVSLDNAVDEGIRTVNVFTGPARTHVDRHFPVPPRFA
jgi:hypothetical protein